MGSPSLCVAVPWLQTLSIGLRHFMGIYCKRMSFDLLPFSCVLKLFCSISIFWNTLEGSQRMWWSSFDLQVQREKCSNKAIQSNAIYNISPTVLWKQSTFGKEGCLFTSLLSKVKPRILCALYLWESEPAGQWRRGPKPSQCCSTCFWCCKNSVQRWIKSKAKKRCSLNYVTRRDETGPGRRLFVAQKIQLCVGLWKKAEYKAPKKRRPAPAAFLQSLSRRHMIRLCNGKRYRRITRHCLFMAPPPTRSSARSHFRCKFPDLPSDGARRALCCN